MENYALLVLLLLVTILNVVTYTNAAKDFCQFSTYESEEAVAEGKKRIAPLVGKVYKSQITDNDDTYKFTVGICTQLDGDPTSQAAVLQLKIGSDGTPDSDGPHTVGSLKDVHIMSGNDWAVLEYKGGEKNASHCNGEDKRTVIMLQCDENIDDDDAKMIYLEEQKNKKSDCYYLFELKHKALCVESSTSSGLSVGSVLVIIFFSVAGVYLIVGFLYSRFVLGAKGIEQIPNYEFWTDFGNLQADGCNFICRTKGRQHSTGFGGLGDDQLEPSDEIRDDNLLPM